LVRKVWYVPYWDLLLIHFITHNLCFFVDFYLLQQHNKPRLSLISLQIMLSHQNDRQLPAIFFNPLQLKVALCSPNMKCMLQQVASCHKLRTTRLPL
jgi:hypothetical protein